MDLDGRSLDATVLRADLCVVGAGPAGLVLASAFAGGSTEVIVLESGGLASEPEPQELNEARVVGDRYAGLRVTRHRQVGGTVNLWNTPVAGEPGAKYAPLDPADVTGLPELPWSGWPIEWTELDRWYAGAREICGLRGLDAPGSTRVGPDRRPLELGSAALETRIYELGSGRVFTTDCPERIRDAANVRLCRHATLCRLLPGAAGDRVGEALVASPDGGRFRVRASIFVLAAGAVENARILLASAQDAPGRWLGSVGHWVGRCFMEHPRDYSLTLEPRPGLLAEAGFYDSHVDPAGAHVLGRLALAEEVRRRERLPNLSVTLVPRVRRRLPRLRHPYPPSEAGWSNAYVSAEPTPARHDAVALLLNLEQPPHRGNRIVLASRRDRLGVPEAELRWRWLEQDQRALERVRRAVAEEVERAGLGRVSIRATQPDPNAHHHAGTTRMSPDPGSGVVDLDGRVHGVANLYACGASVFPTAGFANPTLTIVALALRLAAHLRPIVRV